MSRIRLWITIPLALIAVILFGWYLDSSKNSSSDSDGDTRSGPAYTSAHSETMVYTPGGALSYKLVAEKATYFSGDNVSWFEHPVMTTYDKNKNPGWQVRSSKAKLTNDRMLYLYGDVEVTALTKDTRLQRLKTDNAQVNLVTQDITSEEQATLYGNGFNASGMKLRGNLRTKNAELIEKVKTYYEIQNK